MFVLYLQKQKTTLTVNTVSSNSLDGVASRFETLNLPVTKALEDLPVTETLQDLPVTKALDYMTAGPIEAIPPAQLLQDNDAASTQTSDTITMRLFENISTEAFTVSSTMLVDVAAAEPSFSMSAQPLDYISTKQPNSISTELLVDKTDITISTSTHSLVDISTQSDDTSAEPLMDISTSPLSDEESEPSEMIESSGLDEPLVMNCIPIAEKISSSLPSGSIECPSTVAVVASTVPLCYVSPESLQLTSALENWNNAIRSRSANAEMAIVLSQDGTLQLVQVNSLETKESIKLPGLQASEGVKILSILPSTGKPQNGDCQCGLDISASAALATAAPGRGIWNQFTAGSSSAAFSNMCIPGVGSPSYPGNVGARHNMDKSFGLTSVLGSSSSSMLCMSNGQQVTTSHVLCHTIMSDGSKMCSKDLRDNAQVMAVQAASPIDRRSTSLYPFSGGSHLAAETFPCSEKLSTTTVWTTNPFIGSHIPVSLPPLVSPVLSRMASTHSFCSYRSSTYPTSSGVSLQNASNLFNFSG